MKQITILLLAAMIIATSCCMEYTPSTTVEPEPMPTPIQIVTLASVTPTPEPTPTPTPEACPIPDNYYVNNTAYPFFTERSLEKYLNGYHWNHDTRYTRENHDCSEMAAQMEHDLRNAGCDVFIRCGENYYGEGHAWIMIMYDGEYTAYECTSCYWAFPPSSHRRDEVYYSKNGKYYHDMSYYQAGYGWDTLTDYKDIYAVRDDYKPDSECFLQEWGWWEDVDNINIPWNNLDN